jgi:hypothetical protein
VTGATAAPDLSTVRRSIIRYYEENQPFYDYF